MKKYILSIDAGTTGITLVLVDKKANIVQKEYLEINQYYPLPGWVEHDPIELIKKIKKLLARIHRKGFLKKTHSIGITNQRESIVVWNKKTGKPIYNTIVWQCRRTKKECEKIKKQNKHYRIFKKTGLYLDSYFSATKIKWILENVKNSKKLLKKDLLLCGTIDTWIMWNLTNENNHLTDFTNACRTMLYNINTKSWDNSLLKLFSIPKRILPIVKNSMDDFGTLINTNIPINAVAGDQQSALFGNGCTKPNSSKCTYGTGLFFLYNTGKKRIDSKSKLLTTLAIDNKGKPVYAIEGSIFIGGALIQWLRDELGLIKNAMDTEKIAKSIDDTNNVVIVPAFVGLGAPHWNSNCSGLITGLTRGTNKNHIIRAALESIAYQVNDLLECIKKDFSKSINKLNVDGGATQNSFLMQFQADISRTIIVKPKNIETTAIGVGFMAGLQSKFWNSSNDVFNERLIDNYYKPKMEPKDRLIKINQWKEALKRI